MSIRSATNTNKIQIVFGFLKMTKYEYYSVLKKHPNTNTNTNSCLKCQPNIKIWPKKPYSQ